MTFNMIMIMMLVGVGIAYFSVRNTRRQRERKARKG